MPERAAGVPRALGRAPGCELCAGLAISGFPSVFSLSASRNGASPRVARFPDFLQCFLWLGLETWGAVRGGRFETRPKRILNEFPKITGVARVFWILFSVLKPLMLKIAARGGWTVFYLTQRKH